MEDRNLSSSESFRDHIFESDGSPSRRNSVSGYEKEKRNFSDEGNESVVDKEENFIRRVTEDHTSLTYHISNINSVRSLVRENSEDLQNFIPLDRFADVKSNRIDNKDNVSSLTVMENQSMVKLSDLNSPSGRLSLLGGMESFLSHMESNDVHPNAKTFTLLLASLPSNKDNEIKLMKRMESLGETPEIDFLNDVMMRRNRRNESHTLKVNDKYVIITLRYVVMILKVCSFESLCSLTKKEKLNKLHFKEVV